MIIWLVGLSGSGKTTIGREMYKLWKPHAPNTVMVDGDDIRRILGCDTEPRDYTMEGRRNLAMQYAEICLWLDEQDINVICCTISNFEDIYTNNQERFSNYYQVFIDAPIELLKKRDPKGLYSRAAAGTVTNVVGIDLPFSPPKTSNYTICNDETAPSPEDIAYDILKAAGVV